jgi:hypothetical protein
VHSGFWGIGHQAIAQLKTPLVARVPGGGVRPQTAKL